MEQRTLINTMDVAINLENEEMEYYADIIDTELELIEDQLDNFVEYYNQQFNTNIVAYVFVGNRYSGYGSIGGNGQICGVSCEEMCLKEALYGCDDFAFSITESKTLQLMKMDHDGCNTMELRLVTKNEYETFMLYQDDYFNLAEFVYQLNKKATKLNKHFALTEELYETI
ncbi:hypothetical protein [Staphylococcus gallinarum]|uniref:hypothetical protein n=1 Tax=Staphylococcus gallinarum TaxID=1293 RepID=UPI001E33765A|nr:hypothetical protein [Staphylococcus gallinarum]MCD8845215.1 hypothetical protein [Staphylococcus gallinarum]